MLDPELMGKKEAQEQKLRSTFSKDRKYGAAAEAYEKIAKQLEVGQKTAESLLKAGEKFVTKLEGDDGPELPTGVPVRAHGAVLRQLHALLKERDPSFGGLVRVQNKRQEFLWVHPIFESQY